MEETKLTYKKKRLALAKFMGYKYDKRFDHWCTQGNVVVACVEDDDAPDFHKDEVLLYPVINVIESMGYDTHLYSMHQPHGITYVFKILKDLKPVAEFMNGSKALAIFQGSIKFIETETETRV